MQLAGLLDARNGLLASLPRGAAIAVFIVFAGLLVASAWVFEPKPVADSPANTQGVTASPASPPSADEAPQRDTDLALYDRIIERVAASESYHAVAVEEQRARDFPVRPGVAVRLPTLAHASAALGRGGVTIVAAILLFATFAAWYVRLTGTIAERPRRIIAIGLLAFGCVSGFKPQYFVLHEAWAGMFIALSLGLYRPLPRRPAFFAAAWLAAAAALAVREHALPFVLLLAALAVLRRDWREAGAWAVLVALFIGGLVWHVSIVDGITDANDLASPGWLALRGLEGWAGSIVTSSGLYNLPPVIAAPLALLPMLGWAACNARIGPAAFLLFAGYGALLMIAGREDNFYWALVILPVYFLGFFWVPKALRDVRTAAASG